MNKNSTNIKNEPLLIIARRSGPDSKRGKAASADRSGGGMVKRAGKVAIEYIQLAPELLQAELARFLQSVDTIVKNLPAKVGELSVDSLELSVEITAKGSIGLLGTGGEVGGKGGLTFVLKRTEAPKVL